MKKTISIYLAKLEKIPYLMICFLILVSCLGFILLFSAAQGNMHPWAIRQIIYFCISLPLLFIIAIIDIRIWYKSAYILYFIACFLLLVVHLLGYTAMGATRWIDLKIIKIQPSEIMKICIVFALARYFHDLGEQKIRLKDLTIPIIMLIIPSALIIKQPDLGTGMILLMLGTIIFFMAGVARWIFITGIIAIAVALPLIWQLLYDYQKNRILTFLDPSLDPLGGGYNIIQSKIAIGSGGLWGKGMMQGSQSQLQFLPEHQTDFIFTMLSEEWGFIGGVFLLIIFTVLIFYSYIISLNARSQFAKLLSIGMISMFFLHIFINIAMVMGLLPAVGVPLPLLSYGGTMMLTIYIAFGLIINVHIHNKQTISSALKSYI